MKHTFFTCQKFGDHRGGESHAFRTGPRLEGYLDGSLSHRVDLPQAVTPRRGSGGWEVLDRDGGRESEGERRG